MRARRAFAFASLGPTSAALVAAAATLGLSVARGETFVFRDPTRPPLDGQVIDEFDDLLLVAVDGEAARFVARAELEAVLDEGGARLERPAPGTFARLAGSTPLAAVTDASGGVAVRAGGGADRTDGRSASSAPDRVVGPRPGYLRGGDALVTADDGLARLVTPSGATAKVGPESEVAVEGDAGRGSDGLALRRGELLVEAAQRPLEVTWSPALSATSAPPLVVRAAPGARLSVARGADGSARLLLDSGSAELTGADLRLPLVPGLGATLTPQGATWRVAADGANPGPLELTVAGAVEALPPGSERVVGARAPTTPATEAPASAPAVTPAPATTPAAHETAWTLLAGSGEVLVRRTPAGPFAPASRQEGVPLGAGDAVRAPDGARLTRADGAAATLGRGGALELGPRGLRLLAGEVRLEATSTPVQLDTPLGPTPALQVTARLTRVSDEALDVSIDAGELDLPLADSTLLRPARGATVRVTRLAPPPRDGAGEPAAEAWRGRAELQAGAATLRSRSHRGGPDAQVQALLAAGHVVEAYDLPLSPPEAARTRRARGDRAQAEPDGRGGGLSDAGTSTAPVWSLPGERTLVLDGGQLRARVVFDPRALVTFDTGASVELTPGLWLALDRAPRGGVGRATGALDDRPLLRWRKGPRVVLEDPLALRVHNPRLELLDPAGETLAEVTLEDEVSVRLVAGPAASGDGTATQGKAALVLVARADDRFELPRGASLTYHRREDTARASWSDGRRVWAQDGAQPVQARLDGEQLVVTLVGARPLSLPARSITALATRAGELVILSDDRLAPDAEGITYTAGRSAWGADALPPDRVRDLLNVPLPDSPSGP